MLKMGNFLMIRELYQKGWTSTTLSAICNRQVELNSFQKIGLNSFRQLRFNKIRQ